MLRTPTFRPAVRRHVLPFLFTLLLPCFAKADLGITPVVTQQGNDVYVDFVVHNFTDIASMQFTVLWDAEVAEYVSVENFGLPFMSENNFFLALWAGPGKLTHSWNPSDGIAKSVPDCSTIFRLHLNSLNGQVPPIEIGDVPTIIEVVSENNGIVEFLGITQNLGCDDLGRVSGKIYHDSNENCLQDEGEEGLANCTVRVKSNDKLQFVKANAVGEYFFHCPVGDYEISAILPENINLHPCEPNFSITMGASEVIERDFGSNQSGGTGLSGTADLNGNGLSFKISPNPASASQPIFIETSSETTQLLNLQAYGTNGKLLRQWNQSVAAGQKGFWANTDLKPGLYILKITAANGAIRAAKLVVY
jgi:SdrD B-like domain